MTKNIDIRLSTAGRSKGTYLSAGSLERIAAECLHCGLCQQECSFLQENGLPGQIAKSFLEGDEKQLSTAFSCSLCSHCTAQCPRQLPVADMILEFRKKGVKRNPDLVRPHRPLRFYEAVGGSGLLKKTMLPSGCDTVFFPGCALPGIRTEQALRLFSSLQEQIKDIGFMLDCCSKPSHDLGLYESFRKKNERQVGYLRHHGVRRIITSCPSCQKVFEQYGQGLEVVSAYSLLAAQPVAESLIEPETTQVEYTVHDACNSRFDAQVQESVRNLVKSRGGRVTEMVHAMSHTLCCGEGGGVGFVSNSNKQKWQERRKMEASQLPIITYCAGCTTSFTSLKTIHVLDLVFPGKGRKSKQVVKPPLTYLYRWLFKRKMIRSAQAHEKAGKPNRV